MGDSTNRVLLDTAKYLTSKLEMQNTTALQNKILFKEETLDGKRVILHDIKDAISTYNQSYIEKENELALMKQPLFSTLQDYSLFILFSGFALFALSILIYIFRFSSKAFILSIFYLFLIALLYVFMVFVIQRFGWKKITNY